MRSVNSISQSDITEKWYLIDAEGQRIGLVASKAAELLQGKNNTLVRDYHKPMNKVIVINAAKIDATPKRKITKFYKNYSGFPDGLRFTSLEEYLEKDPTKPIQIAVKGMLPKTRRGDEMIINLRVFAGSEHSHEAQKPEKIDIKNFKL